MLLETTSYYLYTCKRILSALTYHYNLAATDWTKYILTINYIPLHDTMVFLTMVICIGGLAPVVSVVSVCAYTQYNRHNQLFDIL